MKSDNIFPTRVDDLDFYKVVSLIKNKQARGYIVTPNVDHMCRLYKQQSFRALYEGASLILCDSKILQYLSYLRRFPIKNVIRGADLVHYLLKTVDEDFRLAIVGSHTGIGDKVMDKFKLKNIFCHVPPMDVINDKEALEHTIREIQFDTADVVLVAIGSPQQETIASRISILCPEKTLICCGNAINFAVGDVKRSPVWMSSVGLEWLYRCLVEPKRMIPRYLKNIEIFWWFFLRKNYK